MNHPLESILSTYFSQQEEMGIPLSLPRHAPEPATITPAPIRLTLPEQSLSVAVPTQNVPPKPVAVPVPQIATSRSHDQIRAELADLYRRGKECSACAELSRNRTKVVFGAGNASAKIMVIGEAPGYDEDQQGIPFVGAAGQLLNKMLSAINIDRNNETFVSNIIKCRPPGNRTPSTQECLTCLPILKRQIAIIRPSIILILGKTAAQALLNLTDPINRIHGQEFSYHGIPSIVTYHPAALLRDSTLKRPAWEDLQKFQKRYRELNNE